MMMVHCHGLTSDGFKCLSDAGVMEIDRSRGNSYVVPAWAFAIANRIWRESMPLSTAAALVAFVRDSPPDIHVALNVTAAVSPSSAVRWIKEMYELRAA